MKSFFIKFKILKLLKTDARSWSELKIFQESELLFALEELKEDGYILDNSSDGIIGDEFRLSNRKAVRRFIFDRFNPLMTTVGFIGGLIAIVQLFL